MKDKSISTITDPGFTLVTGGTGKTGRRVAERLRERGVETRIASRSSAPSFDWNDSDTWDAALEGVTAAYITYAPDLAIPDAEWTIVRASWFMQNFSEGEFLGMVTDGVITLPAADVAEPFIDINDIADVVVAALTEDGHTGETYEVTGPRMMTFGEIAQEISLAAGREVQFVQIPAEAFAGAIAESGAPEDIAWLLNYLFETVLDGRNEYVCDGVKRALGREPADFADFARRIGARGTWGASAEVVAA